MSARSVHVRWCVVASILAWGTLAAVQAAEPPPPLEEWEGATNLNKFGNTIAPIGLGPDNDGAHSLLIGEEADSSSTGKVWFKADPRSGESNWSVAGESSGDQFGHAMADARDFDGDGESEIIIGAPISGGGVGKIYVYDPDGTQVQVSSNDYEVSGPGGSTNLFGWSVSGIRDVNGDDYDDIVVGSFGESSNTGKIYVYKGNVWPATTQCWEVAETSADYFGYSVSSVGDLDGDDIDDIVVGAPGYNGAGTDQGKVYALEGDTCSKSNAIWTVTGTSDYAFTGVEVAGVGDVNGDNTPDVAIAAQNAASFKGEVNVVDGTDGSAIWTAQGEGTSQKFGLAVATAGDVDGDGLDDVLIGASEFDCTGSSSDNCGKIYLVPGSATGTFSVETKAIRTWTGENAGDKLGTDVANIGSWNEDWVPDQVASAVGWDCASNSDCGKVFGFYGRGKTRSVSFDIEVGESLRDDENPAPLSSWIFGVNRHWTSINNGFEEKVGSAPGDPDATPDPIETTDSKDVLKILEKSAEFVDDAGVLSYRYPGGLQANTYNWYRGVREPWERIALKNSSTYKNDEGHNVGDQWIFYGIGEFLCEVERYAGTDSQGYLPITITLPAPASEARYGDFDAHTGVILTLDPSAVDDWPYDSTTWSGSVATSTGKYHYDNFAADLYEFLNADNDESFNPEPDVGHSNLCTGTCDGDVDADDNIRWARVRSEFRCPKFDGSGDREEEGHSDPFHVRKFEVGNELRVPCTEAEETESGITAGTAECWAWRYTTKSLIPIANALRSMQRQINEDRTGADLELEIGAVSWDSYTDNKNADGTGPAAWAKWHHAVWNHSHKSSPDEEDWACMDDQDNEVRCFDAWSIHIYNPGGSGGAGGSSGIALRRSDTYLDTMRRLPAGTYKLEYVGNRQVHGWWQCGPGDVDPEIELDVWVNGEWKFTDVWDACPASSTNLTNLARKHRTTEEVTLNEDAMVRVRLTAKDIFDQINGNVFINGLLAAIDTSCTPDCVEYFDLRTDHRASLMYLSGPGYWEQILVNMLDTDSPANSAPFDDPLHLKDVFDNEDPDDRVFELWLTEHHPSTDADRSLAEAPNWQMGLNTALTYAMLIRNSDWWTQAHWWQAFEEDWRGMFEGVARDFRGTGVGGGNCPAPHDVDDEEGNDQTCRLEARDTQDATEKNRPRLRPSGKVLQFMAGAVQPFSVLVTPDSSNEKFDTGPGADDSPTDVVEEILHQIGISGFVDIDPDVSSSLTEHTAFEYVQVAAMVDSDSSPSMSHVVVVNLDALKPAEVTLDFVGETVSGGSLDVETLRVDDYAVGGRALMTNHAPENYIEHTLHCTTGYTEEVALAILAGFGDCSDPANVFTRQVQICSHPLDETGTNFCLPRGKDGQSTFQGVTVEDVTSSASVNGSTVTVTVPPASVTIVKAPI